MEASRQYNKRAKRAEKGLLKNKHKGKSPVSYNTGRSQCLEK